MSTRRPDGTHRVVITGTGAVSPAGISVDVLWDAIENKKSCIGPITRFDTSDFDVHIAAEVPAFDPVEQGISKKEARRFARFVHYAIISSDEAIKQSGIELSDENLERFGCWYGSGIGGMEEFSQGCQTMIERGPKRLNPLFIPTMISNMAAGNLSIRYGLKGECVELVTACATGTHNIGAAFRSIKHGYHDVALAGGTEESVLPICIAGFSNLGALSKSEDPQAASLPFDVRRGGFVAGEGAGAVVLESLEHAQARNATILAEVVGFGSTGDAYHMTAPDPEGEGLVRSMRQALEEAGCGLEAVSHINAHGTATPINDRTEAVAIRTLFGKRADELPVVSIKGSVGHTLGAAGALEAVACVLSIRDECVPATAGFAEADPECNVRVLTEPLRNTPQNVILSNSLGFGGHNGSLAIAAFQE